MRCRSRGASPRIAGQSVSVRIWRGHKLLKQVSVRPKPTRTKKTAVFSVRFRPGEAETCRSSRCTREPEQQRRLLAQAALSVVDAEGRAGHAQPVRRAAAAAARGGRLRDAADGRVRLATGLAVLAFRKVNRMPRITTLTPFVVDRVLRGGGGFKVRYPGHGRHVEANLGWQVLALIDKGRVVRAYTTSSGKPSTPTVLGNFRFYMREAGTNSHGMVNSTYFIRGYAIHGYSDVPTYNASHGCLRVPIPDAFAIYSWIHLGDQIDVYY